MCPRCIDLAQSEPILAIRTIGPTENVALADRVRNVDTMQIFTACFSRLTRSARVCGYSAVVESDDFALPHCAHVVYNGFMTANDDHNFSEALRRAIRDARYTQAKLAERLGTDASQVSRWVNGKAEPHPSTIGAMENILQADLSRAMRESTTKYELYVSTPIASLDDDAMIADHNDKVKLVADSIQSTATSFYWPGETIRSESDLPAADLATERNMKIFHNCRALLYLQFSHSVQPSSALIELGLALGRKMETTIVIDSSIVRPLIFSGLERIAAKLAFLPDTRIYTVDSAAEAANLITRNGREILGLA